MHRSSRSIHAEPRSVPPNAPSRPMRRRIALPMPHCVISTSPVRPVRSAKTTDRKPTSSQVRSTPRQAGEIRSPYSVPTSQLLALDRVVAGDNSLGSINLGTRGGASVREVLDAVERVTGRPVPTLYAGRRPGDPAILVADSSRAETVLGWQPRRSSLDEMVSSAWSWRQRFPRGYEMSADRRAY